MAGRDATRSYGLPGLAGYDGLLLGAALALLGLGVVMVTSASITFAAPIMPAMPGTSAAGLKAFNRAA